MPHPFGSDPETLTRVERIAPAARSAPAASARERRTVDAPSRAFHALLALCFLGAYLSADSENWRRVHLALGYACLGLLAFRAVYGLVGPAPQRWVLRARQVTASLRVLRVGAVGLVDVLRAGHAGQAHPTPSLGAANTAVLVLLVNALLLGLPALLLIGVWVDQAWGAEWLQDLASEGHEALGEGLLTLALVHIAWVVGSSVWKQRNLARVMWSGTQTGVGPDLIAQDRRWLAALMVGSVAGWLLWFLG